MNKNACGSIVTGDVHGEFAAINELINKKHPQIIISCGDIALFWGRTKTTPHWKDNIHNIKTQGCKWIWFPGNHENWDIIDKYDRGVIHQLEGHMGRTNVFLASFGSVMDIPGLGRCLFVGGADSIDKQWRIPGQSWWNQEVITREDMEYFFDNHPGKVDVVFSHTCPNYFELGNEFDEKYLDMKMRDPSKEALNIIFDECRPKRWYFGHYHKYIKGQYKDCKWTMLNMAVRTGWWEWLNKEQINVEDIS